MPVQEVNRIEKKLKELKIQDGICYWKKDQNGKKIPLGVSLSPRPRSTDITKWPGTTVDDAINRFYHKPALQNEVDGLGIILTPEKGLLCIDMDHCVGDDGIIHPCISGIISQCDTYIEKSPSGKGLHVLFRIQGNIPFTKTRYRIGQCDREIELYWEKRFITFTGVQIDGTPSRIREIRPEELERIFHISTISTGGGGPHATPEIILREDARAPKDKLNELLQRQDFRQTWKAQRDDLKKSDGTPDWSRYDLSLANFTYHDGWSDQEIADLIIAFRRRHQNKGADFKKALRPDYIQRTIEAAKPTSTGGDLHAPTFFTPGDIQDVKPPPFIWEGIVPQGSLVLLAGKEKSGKSWLCLALACAISKGQKCLGHATKETPIYYFALEDGKHRIKQRLETLGWKETDRPILTLESPFLEDLNKLPDGCVIIIDTLIQSKFYIQGKSKAQGNAYEKDVQVYMQIKKVAKQKNLTIFLVTHLRKAPISDDPLDQITGSKGGPATVDVNLILQRPDPYSPFGELHIRGRDVDTRILLLQFNIGKWTYIASPLESLTQKELTVLNVIIKHPGITTKEIAAKLEIRESTLRTHLASLRRKNVLARESNTIMAHINKQQQQYGHNEYSTHNRQYGHIGHIGHPYM